MTPLTRRPPPAARLNASISTMSKKMKFDVQVIRTGYAFRTIRVEAKDSKEAEDLVLDVAGNYEYSEKSSEYSVQEVDEV